MINTLIKIFIGVSFLILDIIALQTDSSYSFVCDIENVKALNRMYR